MTRKEWHQNALANARLGLSELQMARQAMLDCRKALHYAQDGTRSLEMDRILMESVHSAPELQNLVNALQGDPILDVPMDTDSAGDPERHEEVE